MLDKKRLLFLLLIILFVAGLLFLLILFPNKSKKQVSVQNKKSSSFQPAVSSAISLRQESSTKTAVLIDTGNLAASTVQLDISYNSKVIHNVSIVPADFFVNAYVLRNQIDPVNGTILYVLSISTGALGKQGRGVLAEITYDSVSDSNSTTLFRILPDTKITAHGVN